MKIEKSFFLIVLLLTSVGLIAYSNSWHVPFQFDDEVNILKWWIQDIRHAHSIWDFNVRTRFLPYLSFALNYFFCRENVGGYHVVNFCIHLANSIWVYLLTLLLFKTPKMKGAFSHQTCYAIASFCALIFIAHPLQTQAVTYIVQRISSLAAFFYLGACVLYLQYRFRGSFKLYLGALGMTIAAMFCKENAVTLPLMIVLVDWIFFGFAKHAKRKVFRDLIPLIICAAIVPYFFYFESQFRYGASHLEMQINALPRGQYFLTEFNVLRTYLRLLFVPLGQNVDYDFPTAKTLFQLSTFLSFSLLLALVAVGFGLIRRQPLLAFSIFWFFVTISVESSFFPLDDVIFEHRMYLPLAGCSIFIAMGLFLLVRNLKQYRNVAAGIVVVLCFLTYMRNEVWKSSVTLWTDVIQKSPDKARGYYNLGLILDKQGDYVSAAAYYKQAIQADPFFVPAHINLDVLDARQGHFHAAIPPVALASVNLGVLNARDGHFLQAIENLKRALEIAPMYTLAHDNLAVVYYRVGDFKNALASFKRILEIDPNYTGVYIHIGIFLREKGKMEEALVYFKKALSVNPSDAEAIFQMGKTYIELRQPVLAQQGVGELKGLHQDEMAQKLEQFIQSKNSSPVSV